MKLEEILMSDDVVKSINENLDYLLDIIPEIQHMINFEQRHPHHHLDVWNHTLLALSLSKKDYDVRLALLLHDIGKPFSYQDEEVRHFRNHAKISELISRNILQRLGYNNNYMLHICYLIKQHDIPIDSKQIEKDYETCLTLYEIQRCDALAHNPDKLENRKKYLEDVQKKLIKK